jgi:putative flippase GtrA
MKKVIDLFKKHRELLVYLIFGVLTTAVNLATFYAMESLTDISYLINNAVAWVVGVVFAFVTNKIFVFESKSWKPSVAGKEAVEFLGARLFSFGVEEVGLWLLVDIIGLASFTKTILGFNISGELISKVILAIVVVILNYVFSKLIIFKKKS